MQRDAVEKSGELKMMRSVVSEMTKTLAALELQQHGRWLVISKDVSSGRHLILLHRSALVARDVLRRQHPQGSRP